IGLAVVEHRDPDAAQARGHVGEAGERGVDVAVGPVDAHVYASTASVTLRVMPHDGITALCLPGPPTTTTRMLSGCSVIGSAWSSAASFIHSAHASSLK